MYLRCSAGSVEWMYPTGALIVNVRPNTFPPSRHLTLCIKPLKDSSGANIYLEKTGELKLLVRDGDRGPGQVRCFGFEQGGLFVEAAPQQDISRRTTGFQYELTSRHAESDLHTLSGGWRTPGWGRLWAPWGSDAPSGRQGQAHPGLATVPAPGAPVLGARVLGSGGVLWVRVIRATPRGAETPASCRERGCGPREWPLGSLLLCRAPRGSRAGGAVCAWGCGSAVDGPSGFVWRQALQGPVRSVVLLTEQHQRQGWRRRGGLSPHVASVLPPVPQTCAGRSPCRQTPGQASCSRSQAQTTSQARVCGDTIRVNSEAGWKQGGGVSLAPGRPLPR